jgi:O-antigen/teichoic acid export membrane protein
MIYNNDWQNGPSPHQFHSAPSGSWFTRMIQTSIKTICTLAFLLIGLGILVLLFPLVLAFFVAAICFIGALFFLRYAWTLRRHNISRPHDHHSQVHVTVRDVTDDSQ